MVLTLPVDARYEPPPSSFPAAPGARLDLVVVVDGTLRRFAVEKEKSHRLLSKPLLDRKDLLREQTARLAGLRRDPLAGEGRESRLAVSAFGDRLLSGEIAADLASRYLLSVRRRKSGSSRRSPRGCGLPSKPIPATHGGDFVDALADALQACHQLFQQSDAAPARSSW